MPKKPALWAAIRRIENFGTARVVSDRYLVLLCQKSRRCGLQSAGTKILARQEWFQTDIWFYCAKKAGAVGCNPQDRKFWHGKGDFR
ncbi:MAG: hypothetical protein ACOX3H_08770 [Saccharofermentanales bacterium]